MIGHIIDVEYDDGSVNIAKIVADAGVEFVVVPLVSVYGNYRFSRHPHSVPKESIAGFYDTTELEDTGLFVKLDDTYYEAVTSDSEYECDSDSDTETDVSLEDE